MVLILASQSPRRIELLSQTGLSFQVRVSHIQEHIHPLLAKEEVVKSIAYQKLLAIKRLYPGAAILAADTMVYHQGRWLGKPKDQQEALSMLKELSGCFHQVITGLAYYDTRRVTLLSEITEVHFRELSQSEILAYIERQEPFDKAGGYGIQSSDFVSKIEGSYSNVVGLPMEVVSQLLGL